MFTMVSGVFWGTTLRKWITGTCAMIAAVCGAIVQSDAAFPKIEYVWYAHRGYVRWYSEDVAVVAAKKVQAEIDAKLQKYILAQAQVERTTARIERGLEDGKHEAAQNSLFDAQRRLDSANHEFDKATDPQTRGFIDSQRTAISQEINRLAATKQKIEEKIRSIPDQQ